MGLPKVMTRLAVGAGAGAAALASLTACGGSTPTPVLTPEQVSVIPDAGIRAAAQDAFAACPTPPTRKYQLKENGSVEINGVTLPIKYVKNALNDKNAASAALVQRTVYDCYADGFGGIVKAHPQPTAAEKPSVDIIRASAKEMGKIRDTAEDNAVAAQRHIKASLEEGVIHTDPDAMTAAFERDTALAEAAVLTAQGDSAGAKAKLKEAQSAQKQIDGITDDARDSFDKNIEQVPA